MSGFEGNTFANLNLFAQRFDWGASNSSQTAILVALLIAILSIAFWPSSDGKIYKLQGFHFVILSRFFTKRYDFFRDHLKKTGLKMFRFNVLQVSSYKLVYNLFHFQAWLLIQYRVIAVAGEANRKIFFGDRNLGFSEGYRIFTGGIPNLEDVKDDHHFDKSESIKRLLSLFRRERINEGAPTV